MTSAIISTTIDENFPVAGQDNDSQGFRDNFNIIKTALGVAKNEITDLQDGVARVDNDNNFAGNNISNANLLSSTLEANTTSASGTATDGNISWTEGYIHVVRAENDITLSLVNFPTQDYSKIRIFLTADTTGRNVILSTTLGSMKDDGAYSFASETSNTRVVSGLNDLNPTVFDIFTYNGSAFYVNFVGTFS